MTPLYNRINFRNGDRGYFARRCPTCGYTLEDCPRTREVSFCPLCLQAGKEIKLQPCQVTTWPKYGVKRVHLQPGPDQDI